MDDLVAMVTYIQIIALFLIFRFCKTDVDLTECVYIMHIFVCTSKIICFEIAVFF